MYYDDFIITFHAYVKTFSNLQVLNQIVCELPSEHPLSERRPLRELLGHTPTQVCSNVLFIVHFSVV
jgi:acid phosphatase family membrane protein YuiD